MKVLVTGGNGLTGRYIVRRLAEHHQVEVLDHRVIEQRGVVTHLADILDLPRVKTLMQGCEAVVHLAAIPHPLENPPEEVFRTNSMGTFNVLEAAASCGIRRLVFMSSESVLGFAFSNGMVKPEYLPVDENHPLRPVDSYGLSKVVGESLCAAYSRRYAMTTVCLRPPWIWVPEDAELRIYRDLVQHPEAWPQTLWAYVHVLDVAEAVAKAVEHPLAAGTSGSCFLGAAENWTGRESRDLARKFYPHAHLREPSRSGPYSLLSLERASQFIGFEPKYSYRDLPGLEHSSSQGV